MNLYLPLYEDIEQCVFVLRANNMIRYTLLKLSLSLTHTHTGSIPYPFSTQFHQPKAGWTSTSYYIALVCFVNVA